MRTRRRGRGRSLVRLNRLRDIERTMEQGDFRQWRMALKHSVSEVQICKDVKHLIESRIALDERTGRARRAKRILQFEAVGREAMGAYQRSRLERTACFACAGKGYVRHKGACKTCGGEGVLVEDDDGPGDPALLGRVNECIRECARLEGLYPRRAAGRKKEEGDVQKHLHLHVNLFEDATDEQVLEAKALLHELRNGQGGRKRPVLDAESVGETIIGEGQEEKEAGR